MIQRQEYYTIYIKVDNQNRIVDINSDAFLEDTFGWIKIDSGYGDKYHHAQRNYLEKSIFDFYGRANYKFVSSEIVERSSEEKDKELSDNNNQPSQLDKIEAQITYTAMMTNTLLGGESNV